MLKKLLFFCLFSLLSSLCFADDKGIFDRLYQVLPETDSLTRLGAASGGELERTSIKALIWNIKKTEMKGWQKEFLKFGENKDLILVQEAYTNELLQTTLSAFSGFRWDMGISFLYLKNNNTATGTMIGSSVEPSEILVKHSVDREPILDTPKAVTFAKYPLAGYSEELLVISVHAVNFVTTGAFKRHMDIISSQLAAHQGPILLAGDFNTWNKSRMAYLMNMAKNAGLSTVNFKNGEGRMKFGDYFLDHGFVRGAIVKNAEVLVDAVGSDHKPLVIEMLIL